jgi:hypothetical protein
MVKKFTNTYNLTECPTWRPYTDGSADDPTLAPYWAPRTFNAPPAIGTRVYVFMNKFGLGTVTGYFTEHGFLGVHVRPDVRPGWHVKKNPDRDVICVFGSEIRPPA